ncbi:MAG: DUF493 domain-containing protein [Gammaproteobacteria bacterium]|nr:DUF493 domain-containing protein [Gammaproteobacteria bacterium]
MPKDDKPAVLNFPCDFPIKVFGNATEEFETTALHIIHKHVPKLAENALRSRPSKDNKYLAITVTVNVTSQKQLDDIYRELTACPLVLMAL